MPTDTARHPPIGAAARWPRPAPDAQCSQPRPPEPRSGELRSAGAPRAGGAVAAPAHTRPGPRFASNTDSIIGITVRLHDEHPSRHTGFPLGATPSGRAGSRRGDLTAPAVPDERDVTHSTDVAHSTAFPGRGGQLHRPDDPRAGPRDADVTHRATASAGHRATGSRRTGSSARRPGRPWRGRDERVGLLSLVRPQG